MTYREFKKEEIIYNEDEKVNGFFIIINGDVREEKTKFIFSFLVNNLQFVNNISNSNERKLLKLQRNSNSNTISPKKPIDKSQVPKVVLSKHSDGDIIGVADLLHSKRRSTYLITTSDICKTAFLGQNAFNLCFSKELLRAEYERKDFLSNNLLLCKNLDLIRLNSLYETIQPILLNQGDYFFIEGSSSINLIVILFQGSAVIEKKYIKGDEKTYKEPLKEDNLYSTSKIMYMEPSNIAGLEILNNEKIRRFSMKATSTFASALCINYDELTFELKAKMKENLLEYVKNINTAHEMFYNNYLNIQKDQKVNFKTFNNLKDELYNKEKKIEKIDRYIKSFKSISNIRNHPTNSQCNSLSIDNTIHANTNGIAKKEEILLSEPKTHKFINHISLKTLFSATPSKDTDSFPFIPGTNISFNYQLNFSNTKNTKSQLSQSVKKRRVTQLNTKLDDVPIIINRTIKPKFKRKRREIKY